MATKVLWDAIAAEAEEQNASPGVVLSLAADLMQHVDYAAQSYVEFRQRGLADAARERLDLLEQLLDGRLPDAGSLAAAAERHGFDADTSSPPLRH